MIQTLSQKEKQKYPYFKFMLFAPIGQSIYTTLYESPGAHCFHCTYSHTRLYLFPPFYPHAQIIVTPDFGTSDALSSLSYKYIYWQALQKIHFHSGRLCMGNGFPLFAHGTVGALFLPNLILYKFFPFVLAYNLALITYISILGIGTYVLLKKLQNINCPAFWISFFIFRGCHYPDHSYKRYCNGEPSSLGDSCISFNSIKLFSSFSFFSSSFPLSKFLPDFHR